MGNKMWSSYHGILLSPKKEGTSDTSYITDEPGGNDAERNKPVTKVDLPAVPGVISFLETESRRVAAGVESEGVGGGGGGVRVYWAGASV